MPHALPHYNGIGHHTVLFEESMLSLGPAALLMLLTPFRLAQLYGENNKL